MSLFREPTFVDKVYKGKKDRNRKNKNTNEESDAIKELQTILSAKKRIPCGCEAQTHPLLANCLDCGRLICNNEGPGECFHCGTLILSKEQRDRIGKHVDINQARQL